MSKKPENDKNEMTPSTRKKIISALVMVAGILLFLFGFYFIGPKVGIKGYLVIIGLIATVYGFINILT